MIIRSNQLSLASSVIGLPVIGYENIVTNTNIESNTAEANFPVTNLANPATHLIWKSSVNTGDEDIDIHPGNAPVDYVGIAGHNFGTAGATITISGGSDATSPFDSPGLVEKVQATVITDDLPLIFQFVQQQMLTLRIKIQFSQIQERAAVIYCGRLLTLERGVKVDVDHKPVNLNRKNSVINGYSESGNFLGRLLKNATQESEADFAHFTNSWYRANFDPFLLQARGHPFFISWAPNDYPTDTGFCWITEDVEPSMNPVTRRFSASIKVRGLA